MTETQAKSGNAGTSANPVDEEAAKSGTPTTGRAAVGRATVPADAPAPKFTRAPGMAPPPDKPTEGPEGDDAEAKSTDGGSATEASTSPLGKPSPTQSAAVPAGKPSAGTTGVLPAASTGTTGTQPRVTGVGPKPDATRSFGLGRSAPRWVPHGSVRRYARRVPRSARPPRAGRAGPG